MDNEQKSFPLNSIQGTSLKYPLLFIRGLNTQGDDRLRIGPFPIGKMLKYFEKNFRKMGVFTLLVNDLKCDTLSKQTETCVRFIKNRGIQRFHVLGHSMGGLTARALSHQEEISEKVISMVTVATPHNGSRLAEMSVDLHRRYPRSFSLLKKLNRSVKGTEDVLNQITPGSLDYFNRLFPLLAHVRSGCVVCRLSHLKQSYVFRIFHMALRKYQLLHDGMLESASQEWGEKIGEYELDHLSQLGYHCYLSPRVRSHREQIFQQMIRDIFNFMKAAEEALDSTRVVH